MGGLFCYGLRQIYLKRSGGCAGVSQRTSVSAKTGLQKFCKKKHLQRQTGIPLTSEHLAVFQR